MIRITYADHVIRIFKLNIQINSLNRKPATATRIPDVPPTNQPPQQSLSADNTFTSTQATPHSTGKTNKAESKAHANDTNSKTNLIREEKDTWIILKLSKIAGAQAIMLVHLASPLFTLISTVKEAQRKEGKNIHKEKKIS